MFARRNKARSQPKTALRTRKLQLETLEARTLLATFTVVNTNDSGEGSLRAAMESANSNPGFDRIEFNIPGPGQKTINLLTELPDITDVVSFDTSRQLPRNEVPPIEIRGGGQVAWGLTLRANDSFIGGLVLNGFTAGGIRILGGHRNAVQFNYIGVTPLGDEVPVRGSSAGILLAQGSTGNQIGGEFATPTNLIAGFEQGIRLDGAETRRNIIRSNTIGLPGGTGLHNGIGILFSSGATGNAVGPRPTPFSSSPPNLGVNAIAGNLGAGVAVTGASHSNAITANVMHSNGGLDIDLGNNGPTRNDLLDVDVGPNQLMNYPVLQSFIDRGTHLMASGVLHSRPNQVFTVHLFAGRTAGTGGRGQAERPLRDLRITTDADGTARFAVTISRSAFPEGWLISASVTNQFNNTSELSPALALFARGTDAPLLGQGGTQVTYVAQAPPVLVAPAGRVVDPYGNEHYKGGWFSVKVAIGAEATDRLTIRHQGNGAGQIGVSGNEVRYGGMVIGTFSGGDGSNSLVIGLNSNATSVAVQALMRRIAFDSTDANPSTTRRLIQFQIGDGRGNVNNAFAWLDVEENQ
jgi:hypothetical protein